jgi:phytoene dehydrogenase-like protein
MPEHEEFMEETRTSEGDVQSAPSPDSRQSRGAKARRGPRAVQYDAVVVGSGPNGLVAAITLAEAGLSTLVFEADSIPGGGTRTAELTLPLFRHDVCSSVHPLGIGSPVLSRLLHEVEWVQPPAAVAHPFEDGSAVTLERTLLDTAAQLGRDAKAYQRLMSPFVAQFEELVPMILGPARIPSSPLLLARFGMRALWSMEALARMSFREPRAAALVAGIAAHSMLRLDAVSSSAIGIVLGAAGHAVGWPLARGGSQSIADALIRKLKSLGGEVVTGVRVRSLAELPAASAYLFDVSPRQLVEIAGSRFPSSYRRRLERFRYGPGVFKIDYAMSGPIPWRNPACARAATVHLGGTLENIARSERSVHEGKLSDRPYVLLVQPTLFDPDRAPKGGHIAWAYCHVPRGSSVDAHRSIETEIERYAPGFRDLVLARSQRTAVDMEAYNPNYVGGDINGGEASLTQLFTRPVARIDPYATPARDIFLCSASAPPGGGVHGMCGYWAARSALAHVFDRKPAFEVG